VAGEVRDITGKLISAVWDDWPIFHEPNKLTDDLYTLVPFLPKGCPHGLIRKACAQKGDWRSGSVSARGALRQMTSTRLATRVKPAQVQDFMGHGNYKTIRGIST
jgi:hypothetical protein